MLKIHNLKHYVILLCLMSRTELSLKNNDNQCFIFSIQECIPPKNPKLDLLVYGNQGGKYTIPLITISCLSVSLVRFLLFVHYDISE